MKPIAKNNCDFPSLRKSGCLYIDKTAWLARLATDQEAYFTSSSRVRAEAVYNEKRSAG